jgi:hypothetical protein
VVKGEISGANFESPKAQCRKPKRQLYPADRIKFVQALQEQGYQADAIVEKGGNMNSPDVKPCDT